MQIHISKKVAEWYRTELQLEDGDYLRFFPRYGGVGGNIPGFSIGINNSEPNDYAAMVTVDNISFYIERQDQWYFEDKDLKITFNTKLGEPKFSYV